MQLGEVDALHGLQDEVLGVGVVLLHVIEDDLAITLGLDAGLVDPLQQELLAQLGIGGQNLGSQVLQVHDLHAVVAQGLCEGVVLLLGNLQERDVVEQQLLECVRGEVQQLLAGAVQQHLLERLDLAFDVHASHCKPSFVSWDIRLSSPCKPSSASWPSALGLHMGRFRCPVPLIPLCNRRVKTGRSNTDLTMPV